MPATLIETREGWLAGRQAAFIETVQSALTASLKLPEWDRCTRLVEHPFDRFITPIGRGPGYTLITVTLFAGRSLDAKRALYRNLAEGLAPFGLAPGDISVPLIEVAKENWGLRGQPVSEIDLGFTVEV